MISLLLSLRAQMSVWEAQRRPDPSTRMATVLSIIVGRTHFVGSENGGSAEPDLLLDLFELISLSSNFWQGTRRREAGAAMRMKLELTGREPRHDRNAAHI